jgi:hypothetical protein
MTHRRALSLLWILLPLMVARVLLPPGYMPGSGTDGMALVMCSGAVIAPDGDGPAPDAGHEGKFSCPFAQAPALAAAFAMPWVHAAPPPRFAPLAPRLLAAAPTGPPRTGRARGPPLHS